MEDVEDAVARLRAIGELDDGRFARRYAEDKRELRGWGPERIREALEARGLPTELIDAAIGEERVTDQVERAAALLVRRGASLADDAGRASAFGFLARRGYGHEVAYAAIRRAGEESR